MAEEVKLPQLGESVTEGVITAWLAKEGDEVAEDQPLFEISTEKVDTEVPSPASGVLTEIRAEVDQTVEVGEVVAIIASPGEAAAEPGEARAAAAEAPTEEEPGPPRGAEPHAPEPEAEPEPQAPETGEPASPPTEPVGAAAGEREAEEARARGDGQPSSRLLSPIVRKLAREHDIDVSKIHGSGKAGRVTREDIERAIQAGTTVREPAGREPAAPTERRQAPRREAPAPRKPARIRGRQRTEPLSRIRKVIARSMWESLQTTAQLTAAVEADMTRIMRLRAETKDDFQRREGVPLSPLPFVARAVCMTLPNHPVLNAAIDVEEGTATYYDFVNLGIAVDTEAGLIVPNVKGADDLTIPALARHIADLAERTRSRQLQPDDVQGGTFTITNTGSRGVLFDTPILNPPEVAILATPKIEKRPVVVTDPELGDTIAIRWMTYLCVTYDHRMVDGADAARFLTDLTQVLETHDFAGEVGMPGAGSDEG